MGGNQKILEATVRNRGTKHKETRDKMGRNGVNCEETGRNGKYRKKREETGIIGNKQKEMAINRKLKLKKMDRNGKK